jgi:Uma2 family endonuclease
MVNTIDYVELEAELEEEEEELEEPPMTTPEHSLIALNIGSEIRFFVKGKSLGLAFESGTEYRYLPKTISAKGKEQQPFRKPDVSFIIQERLPANLRDYLIIAPDLAVEISSPSDTDYDIELKIKEYQRYNVRLIWIVHPISRSVDVYHLSRGARRQNFIEGDVLSGEDVLTGFTLNVTDIFDYPAPPDPVSVQP